MARLPVVSQQACAARLSQPEPPILRETAAADGGSQYPTPPFTPRAAGSYKSSYPAGLSEAWSSMSSGYDSYRPRTMHGYGHQRVTRRFFVGSGALQPDRAQGRERVVEKTTVGCPKHYDVLVDDEDGLEYTGDHVRYRYVDFLTSRPLADGAAAAQTFESTQAVAKWLDTSHPYTRLDAYPLFILAKDVIRRLLRHELHSHDNEKVRIALELSQLKAKIAELTRITSAKVAELTKRCEDLSKENQSMSDLRIKAEQEWTALQGDFADHKLATQQAAEVHSTHIDELKREIEEQRRQHEEAHDKLKRELAAAHAFDEDAVKSTLQKVLSDLDEFSADGRDHHEDKLLLLRRLCCTFSLHEHADVLKAFFFSLGDFDVTQLYDTLLDDQRVALLKSLLDGMDPAAVLGHLAIGRTEVTDTTTVILRDALAKGCDADAILNLLESELGREALISKLRGEIAQVGTQCELVVSSGVQGSLDREEEAVSVRKADLPPVSKHLRFLHKDHEGVSALLMMKAHNMIGEIYEQKALSDRTDDISNHRRKPFAEFLRHWALHQFGLKSIANKNLAALVTTVRENEALALAQTDGKISDHVESPSYDIRLRTFGYLSGILSSPYEHTELPVNFCMDFLRRIFKGDQTNKISELMQASSKSGSKRGQGHLQIPWQMAFDELVSQLKLYGVTPPSNLESQFQASSIMTADKGGLKRSSSAVAVTTKLGADHLHSDQVINLDAVLELARKTLVDFVGQKRAELEDTFYTYVQSSPGGQSGTGDGNSATVPTVKMDFVEFVAMVEAVDATRYSEEDASDSTATDEGKREDGDAERRAGWAHGYELPVRSHHELVDMYATATGQHHDDDEMEDNGHASGVITLSRFVHACFMYKVGVGLHFSTRHSLAKRSKVAKAG